MLGLYRRKGSYKGLVEKDAAIRKEGSVQRVHSMGWFKGPIQGVCLKGLFRRFVQKNAAMKRRKDLIEKGSLKGRRHYV